MLILLDVRDFQLALEALVVLARYVTVIVKKPTILEMPEQQALNLLGYHISDIQQSPVNVTQSVFLFL